MNGFLICLFIFACILIRLILKAKLKKDTIKLINHVKGRFDYYIVECHKKDQLVDLNEMLKIVSNSDSKSALTYNIVDLGHYYEIDILAGAFRDCYYYIPGAYGNVRSGFPRDNYTDANTYDEFMHKAHINLVNVVSWKQVQLVRPLTRLELDEVLKGVKALHPRVNFSDFKIKNGWVMIRMSNIANFDISIEQILPYR